MRNATLSFVLLAGCVFCFAIASQGVSAPGGGFKPVSSVESLMNGQGLVFTQIRDAVGNKMTPERTEVIEHMSEVLAELSNVNTYQKDADDYRNWASKLRETALELAEEAEKDAPSDETMQKLVGELKNTCQSCHDKYN